MENKKIGGVLIAIAGILLVIAFMFNANLTEQSKQAGCYTNEACIILKDNTTIVHFIIGVISFILALGFYLLFFNKTEKAIFEKLKKDNEKKIQEMKYDLLLKALDEHEKKVVDVLNKNPGITQSSLRIKLDMSKAKLSYVLKELERRNIIKRKEKGKTLKVYLKI